MCYIFVQIMGQIVVLRQIIKNRGNFIPNRSKSVKNITKSYIFVTKLIKMLWAIFSFYEQILKIVEILYEIY